MKPPENRLKFTLLAWLLWPLMGLLIIDTLATYGLSLKMSNLAHDRSLHEIAREVALHVKPLDGKPALTISNIAEQILLVDQDDRVRYRVWSRDGTALGGDPQLLQSRQQPPADGKALFYDDIVLGEKVRVAAAWLPFNEANMSELVLVQVAETTNKRQRLMLEILANVIVAQMLLIAMATAAVFFGVSRGLRPLSALARALAGRSHLDLSPIDPRRAPLEVRPLLDEVNALMLRLSGTLDMQNRFIADAAHQLKTPVAGLKAQIELALAETEPAEQRRSLGQLYLGAERLSRLVQQLLSLARNEPGAAQAVKFQRLDLNAFALEICMEWAPQAVRRAVDLGFEGSQSVMLNADPDRLRELINNLIDNGVRYSHQGGRVTVAVRYGTQGEPVFMVSDDGPSIPVQERDRVFERFHRLLGTDRDGSGLGLAIVSEIAAIHAARITLEDDVDGTGNTFSVHFPHQAD
jgi:two-component system sensor histidine kinase TctE